MEEGGQEGQEAQGQRVLLMIKVAGQVISGDTIVLFSVVKEMKEGDPSSCVCVHCMQYCI